MILHHQPHFLLIIAFVPLIYCGTGHRIFNNAYGAKDYDGPLSHHHKYYPKGQDSWSIDFSKSGRYQGNSNDKKNNYEESTAEYDHHDYDNNDKSTDDLQDYDVEFDYSSKKPANKKPTYSTKKPVHYNQYNNKYDINKLDKDRYSTPYRPVDKYTSITKKPNPTKSNSKIACYDREHTCVPQTRCPLTRFENFETIQKCTLPYDGKPGVCCPSQEYPTARQPIINLPISRKATKVVSPKEIKFYPNVNRNQYRVFGENYEDRVKYIKQIERALVGRKLTPSRNSPELAHHNFFGNYREALRLGLKGESAIQRALESAKKHFSDVRLDQSKMNSLMASTNIDSMISSVSECPKDPVCSLSRYRNADGSCNNLLYPSWGKAFSPYNRVLNPSYGDGINSPRLSRTKTELPNARDLSIDITRHRNPPKSRLTLAAMQFGQLIDHDFASAAPTRTAQGSAISCCRPEIQADPANLKHPSCFEIPISKNDPFFKQFNVTCMNFVRSIATPRADCRLAPREQLNQPTSFVDGSQIYGSSVETQKSLRAFYGGRLLSSLSGKIEFPPRLSNGTCNVPNNEPQQCFRAGDPRINENIDLTIMQTIMLREHNRIAKELNRLNPHWSDEHVFQETKLIVGALIQHILYTEWLPVILNRQTLIQFGLMPTEEGFIQSYNPKINPMLFNAFASSSFRLHSSIQGSLQVRNNQDDLIGEVPLSATFNNPTLLAQPRMFDGLLMGMTSQPMQEVDQFFTRELTNKLFRPWNSTFGLDLFALNVQRGRDHGLKGYPSWLKQCALNQVKSFSDLEQFIPRKLVKILRRHYASVADIDLYLAGIIEYHLPNSELGPLLSCIIAEQFRRLKYGDRFFYENSGQINSFTPAQLAEIKKVTIARLFCDNGEDIEIMQPHAFILPKYWWNKKVSCNSELIPRMSLYPWAK